MRDTPMRSPCDRGASLTGVQLSQRMHIAGFQILALTVKLTQAVPRALHISTMLLHHCMMAGFHGIVSLRWIKSYVATFVMS